MIDLMQFCEDRHGTRPALQQPWQANDYVYASDGRIIVRVRALDYPDVKMNPVALRGPSEDKSAFPWEHSYLLAKHWIKPTHEMRCCNHPPCMECNGTGMHVCPQCEKDHECGTCDGWGRVGKVGHVDVGPIRFSTIYCYLLCRLPEVELWIDPKNKSVHMIPFRFAGGLGYVMPMRK